MPPPSSENDLKRRARRRLIGAVALTLLAVIVLPLLLEDEPPPASSLAVRMAVMPETVPDQAVPSEPAKAPDTADVPASPPPPAPKSPPEPLKAASPKPAPKPQHSASGTTPAPQARPVPANETFVVQLAALSDATKADALKGRAALAGLPAYTDKLGGLTRVRVGPYSSREAAETAAKKLADNGLPAGQVVAK
jgi:DedD protein